MAILVGNEFDPPLGKVNPQQCESILQAMLSRPFGDELELTIHRNETTLEKYVQIGLRDAGTHTLFRTCRIPVKEGASWLDAIEDALSTFKLS